MAYVTLNDVRSAAPQLRLTDASRPNEAEVRQIINRVEAELEIVIRNLGFKVPVTGVASLMIIKSMVISEVVAQILEAQYAGVGDPKGFGSEAMHRRYVDRVKALVDPNDPFTLPDAEQLDVQEKLVGETAGIATSIGIHDDDYRITRDIIF